MLLLQCPRRRVDIIRDVRIDVRYSMLIYVI